MLFIVIERLVDFEMASFHYFFLISLVFCLFLGPNKHVTCTGPDAEIYQEELMIQK